MGAEEQSGDVIVDDPQPCANCGVAAHIVMKDSRRLCARCFREEKRESPQAASS